MAAQRALQGVLPDVRGPRALAVLPLPQVLRQGHEDVEALLAREAVREARVHAAALADHGAASRKLLRLCGRKRALRVASKQTTRTPLSQLISAFQCYAEVL